MNKLVALSLAIGGVVPVSIAVSVFVLIYGTKV